MDATEQLIVTYLDAHTGEAVSLLEQVVNINSGTMNQEGVREVGQVFRAELDQLGFQTEWISMEQVNRAGHLFAYRRGNRGMRLLLIGHLDTVFERDSPFQRFRRQGSQASGPGTDDMKGGDVVLIYALRALQAAGALEGTTLTVALTGDEEDTGDPLSIGRADLTEAARHSDIALGFEGAAGNRGRVTVARRGFTGWELRARGRDGHSSRIFKPDFGAGAIYQAASILKDFYRELRGEDYLTFSPGLILGGSEVEFDSVRSRGSAFGKTNVIAASAVVAGDLRCISEEQRERAKEKMRRIVARHLPLASAEITFQDSYPPMSPTPGNYELLERLDQISRDLGLGPVEAGDPGERGAADVSFAAPHVSASLDGLGIVGSGAHTDRERVDLDSIASQAKKAAILIYRLTR